MSGDFGRSGAAPLALLLCTLASVALFGPDRDLFLGKDHQSLHSLLTHAESMTYDHLFDVMEMSPRHYFVSARSFALSADGEIVPGGNLYNRFPIGGRLLLHLATLPFDDPWRNVRAVRALIITFFLAAATLAYFALTALAIPRWAAVAATLLAFGSGYHFAYHDLVATQGVVDLFGVMLVFQGMAAFHEGRRLGQLLIKACVALLLGWHVYGLLLPFVALGIVLGFARGDWSGVFRHLALGATALLVGACALAFNLVGEFLALGGQTPWTELSLVRSALFRTGLWPTRWADVPLSPSPLWSIAGWTLDALWAQFARVGTASLPHVLISGFRAGFNNAHVAFVLGCTGMAATVAAVGLGATAKRGRIALTSVALAGWCWALPMRNAVHPDQFEFEALFYVGVPLVLYALALAHIGARRFGLAQRRIPLGPVAAIASLCFVGSGMVMAVERHASVDFEREAALRSDVGAIRELAPEGTALHVPRWNAPLHWKYRYRVLLAGRNVLPLESAEHVVAFALPDKRSLTPGNQEVFLFRRLDYEAAAADMVARYRAATEQSRPVVTSDCCDVYSFGDEILYHDRHCRLPRVVPPTGPPKAQFFLHVIPVNVRDLPVERRPFGFGNYNFESNRLQHRDGFCFTARRLPPYDIAEVHTGQFQKIWLSDRTAEYRELWGGRFAPAPARPDAGSDPGESAD